MTGTTVDIIPIVIVPVVALAFCLVMIYYADSHPRWGRQAPADTVSTRRAAALARFRVWASSLAGAGGAARRRGAAAGACPRWGR